MGLSFKRLSTQPEGGKMLAFFFFFLFLTFSKEEEREVKINNLFIKEVLFYSL